MRMLPIFAPFFATALAAGVLQPDVFRGPEAGNEAKQIVHQDREAWRDIALPAVDVEGTGTGANVAAGDHESTSSECTSEPEMVDRWDLSWSAVAFLMVTLVLIAFATFWKPPGPTVASSVALAVSAWVRHALGLRSVPLHVWRLPPRRRWLVLALVILWVFWCLVFAHNTVNCAARYL